MHKVFFAFVILPSITFRMSAGKCPDLCTCDKDGQQRKRVTCDKGGMTEIPTLKMDKNLNVLIITAPPDRPNRITVGRIFQDFHDLQEVRITYSLVPAIGDSSFWPGKNLKILDLSHNNITFVRDKDFFGLQNLRVLDLSYNSISAAPSAPFRLLTSLTTLSLARNKMRTLVPRFFYMLSKLEKLDLTGNPLQDLDPENLKDVRPLKRFHLAKCRLKRFHSLIYQQLPNLEELDLRDNAFSQFSPEEFRHLKRLKYLHLDGNRLTAVMEKTFDGHSLRHLGLSRNNISKFMKCAFCNLSIQQLDLSHNNLSHLPYHVLLPLSNSLESLDLSYNKIESSDLEMALNTAHKLKKLSLSGMDLNDLSDTAFVNNQNLKTLDLSHNLFSNFSIQTLTSLPHIEEVDLSSNQFEVLEQGFLDQLQNITSLSVLHLHSNPWSCHQCSVLPLLKWVRQSTMYSEICGARYESSTCLRCATPLALEGRTLHSLKRVDLEPCSSIFPQSHTLEPTSNASIVATVSITAIIIVIIVCALMYYNRHRAVYYTKEGERSPTLHVLGLTHNYEGFNGGTFAADRRQTYFVTLDKIDEQAQERIVASTEFKYR